MRMYPCIGLDDKHLADWSHISGKGNAGEQIILLVGSAAESKET